MPLRSPAPGATPSASSRSAGRCWCAASGSCGSVRACGAAPGAPRPAGPPPSGQRFPSSRPPTQPGQGYQGQRPGAPQGMRPAAAPGGAPRPGGPPRPGGAPRPGGGAPGRFPQRPGGGRWWPARTKLPSGASAPAPLRRRAESRAGQAAVCAQASRNARASAHRKAFCRRGAPTASGANACGRGSGPHRWSNLSRRCSVNRARSQLPKASPSANWPRNSTSAPRIC